MAYRVHPKNESPETVLNHDRPMGWTVDGETPIRGISACTSVASLALYAQNYGMSINDADLVLEINGGYMDGHDGTIEVVCLPSAYSVLCTGAEFKLGMAIAANRWIDVDADLDAETVAEELNINESDVTSAVLFVAYAIANNDDCKYSNPFA